MMRSGTNLRARTCTRAGLALTLGVASVALLAGCVGAPAPKSSTPVAEGSGSASPTPTASPSGPPVLHPDADAATNFLFFSHLGKAKFEKPNITGRTIIDDLVAAGFVKKDMEITPDKTSIGLQAWNIEFSVKMKGSCLIGQAGNVGFHSFVAPLLASGKCLIGQTRKIDW